MALLSGTYAIDPYHSNVGFVVRHLMITKIHGYFRDFAATVTIDAENPENSHAEGTVQTASIDTAIAPRDEHLRSDDFFSVENYPEITFKTTKIDVKSEEKAVVTADLTIKGVTQPVEFDVDVKGVSENPLDESTRIGFSATTTIDRTKWGIDFNAPLKTGGVLLSNEIELVIDGSAVKQ